MKKGVARKKKDRLRGKGRFEKFPGTKRKKDERKERAIGRPSVRERGSRRAQKNGVFDRSDRRRRESQEMFDVLLEEWREEGERAPRKEGVILYCGAP